MFEHLPVFAFQVCYAEFYDFFRYVHLAVNCNMTSWYDEYSLHQGSPELFYKRFLSRCPLLFEAGIQTLGIYPPVWDVLCDLLTCPQRIQCSGFLTMLLDTALTNLVLFWQRDRVESPFHGVVASVSSRSSLDMECTFQCTCWPFGTCLERST